MSVQTQGKIYIVASINFPEGMASTACVSLMAKGLKENGADVCLAIPSKTYNSDVETPNKIEGVFNGIPYHFFCKHPAKNTQFSWAAFKNIKDLSKHLANRRKTGNNDTVLLYENNVSHYFLLFLTCMYYNINCIPWEVEKRCSAKPPKSIRAYINWLGYKLGESFIRRFSKGLIVISTQLQSYFGKTINQEKIHLSPIMVDPSTSVHALNLLDDNVIKIRFDAIKQCQKVVIYSGSFGEKDGFPYILKAIAQCVKEGMGVSLVTTGKPNRYTPIESIIKSAQELGLGNNFHYLGLVSRNELAYINHHANILMVCRSNSEFANHGFPWKLGEYLMAKRPIVATRVGDVKKYFTEEELFLVEPEDSDSLYKQIKHVLSLSLEANVEKAYQKALLHFDYKKVTKLNLEFIKNII